MYVRHPARLRNRIPEILQRSGISERELGERAARALGRPLDRRTLRHYLDAAALEAPALTALAAICAALEVPIGAAVELEREESVDEALRRAGVRVVSAPTAADQAILSHLPPLHPE
ncbi:MAG: hypothetical protein ACYDGR_04380, partial [Candidatus Dormibacteria bacterium]